MKVLITGGSSAIGKALARHCLSLNHTVLITCSSEKSLEATMQDYEQDNLKVGGIVYDFAQATHDIEKLATLQIDALILNAFSSQPEFKAFHDCNFKQSMAYLHQNISGNALLCHQLLPHMVEQQFGRLIFISSFAASTGTSRYGYYACAKGALESLMLNLAVDYSKHGVLSNTIRLGIIKTARNKRFWLNTRYRQKMGRLIPQGQLGEAHQVAEVLTPLLSKNSYQTGAVIEVGGGLPMMCSEGLLT